MLKVIHGTPYKTDYYTASVNVVLDYGDKRGVIAISFLKQMYWNNTMRKWIVPSDPYSPKCKDIDVYLAELNSDKDIPYKVIRFECDGYIDDSGEEKEVATGVVIGDLDLDAVANGFEQNKKQKENAVQHPSHYNMGGIECIDGIKAALGENYIGFLIGNVIKYCWRYKYKNGLEDIKKAQYYIENAIGELENDKNK